MRYVPSHYPRRVTAHLHLQPIYRFPTFDSPQLVTGAPAAITATVDGEVAIVFCMAAYSLFDDSVLAHAVS